MLRVNSTAPCMISSIRAIIAEASSTAQAYTASAAAAAGGGGGGWPAGLRRCCCRVNVTLFSRVTLIRKLQTTSDIGHFHARPRPYSRVKSRDDPISGRRGDSGVLFSFIYIDALQNR